jgi:hypothetical protein
MLLILAFLAFILVGSIELPGLIKNRLYRELSVFTVLFLLGVYMTLAQLYGWPLIDPLADLYPRLETLGG